MAEHQVLHLQLGHPRTARGEPQHSAEHEIHDHQEHQPIVRNRAPPLEKSSAPPFQTGLADGTVPDAMSEALLLTIVYEDAGDGDGWVVARIPQVHGAISQGANRDEARENVIDALRELLATRFGAPPELPDPTDSDSLELTIAA